MKNHLLLINPAINKKSQSAVVNRMVNKMLPTSLGVLAGYITQSGLTETRIVDEQISPLLDQDLEAQLLSLAEPRLVGISVLTLNSARAYALSQKIKRLDPRAYVIMGGIHPTVLPEEVLSTGAVDVVARGEAEETLEELCRCLLNQEDYRNIQGISCRDDGSLRHNPARPPLVDLDRIPPFPYHLFAAHKDEYSSFGTVFGSRGCPYNCIFCSSRSISGKAYRFFSVDRVVSEIKELITVYGQRDIWLSDDNIGVKRRRLEELISKIIAEGFHLQASFHGSMRGDNADINILTRMREANFKMVAFGLETGSERLMKVICKGETVQQVADAIKSASQAGLSSAATIIFGLPGETNQERKEAIKLVKRLPLSSVRFNTLTPYPGTPSFELAQKEGTLIIKEDWSNFAVQYMWEGDDIPYTPVGTCRYLLMFQTMWANLSFYLRPRGLWLLLHAPFAGGNVLKLSRRWFLSPRTLFNSISLLAFMAGRFFEVTFKMLLGKFRPWPEQSRSEMAGGRGD